MVIPDGYRFRAPTPDDLEAAGALLIADDQDDAGVVTLDAEFIRDEWSHAGFELGRDGWVAVDRASRVVAYGHLRREEPDVVESLGIVHPEHRGRGLGSSLLSRIEERAAELLDGIPAGRFRHAINAEDGAAAAMLHARGLRPIRHFWHMHIDLEGPVAPGPAPKGVEIRPISPADLPAVHAVIEGAFADHWGHRPVPYERWLDEGTSSPSYDPTLWLIATEAGHPVGALTASVLNGRGWVGLLGVARSHRGRGLGAALLRHSFAELAGRGIRDVILNVDAENPTGATALYERVGMRVVKRWDLWERPTGA